MSLTRQIRDEFALGVAYFVAAALSLLLARVDGGVPFLWLPASITIAALRVRSHRQWPGTVLVCAVAGFVASALFGAGWTIGLAINAVNALEAVVAAELLRRTRLFGSPHGSLGWIIEFVVPIAVIAPGLSGALMWLLAPSFGLDPAEVSIQLMCGHALGNLIFTPLTRIVALGGLGAVRRELSEHGPVETICLLTLVAGVSLAVFSQNDVPILFLPFVPMVLVAFRLGITGSVLGLLIVAIVAAVFTMHGTGPVQLSNLQFNDEIRFLQFYLAAILLTVLPVAADLRNRVQLHRAMQLSEQRYRLLAEHSSDMLIHLEMDGSIRYASPAMKQITGFDPDALIGSLARNLVPIDQRPILLQGHLATLAAQGGTNSIEYIGLTKGGGRIWLESRARALMDEKGEIESTLCIVRDVSDRKEKELRLSEAAMTDPLTGLANRRAFEAAVAARTAVRNDGETDCIALFDIDLFKRVNDTDGHDAGDVVLCGFAKVLSGAIRRDDTVARIGGEEFAVLFSNSSIPDALMICERIRQEMAQSSVEVGGQAIRVTVSGGVAILCEEGIERALKQADQALYAAKRGGRDQMALAA